MGVYIYARGSRGNLMWEYIYTLVAVRGLNVLPAFEVLHFETFACHDIIQ